MPCVKSASGSTSTESKLGMNVLIQMQQTLNIYFFFFFLSGFTNELAFVFQLGNNSNACSQGGLY